MSVTKDELRQQFASSAPSPTDAGKIAERLRRIDQYRSAETILMMPSPLLFQARINCLLDGKILIMPSPALKLGFYRVKPFSIAFPDLAYGTSLKGITLFGKKLLAKQLRNLTIDLALCGCSAIDSNGGRLGEGTGFFDLTMGLLATLGSLPEATPVGCVAGDEQIIDDPLPCDSWDVGVDFLVLKDEETFFQRGATMPAVDWSVLDKKRIRKVEPLWNLYCEMHPPAKEESVSVDVAVEKPSPWAK